MGSANDRLADAAVSRALDLTRYSNWASARVVALLSRADPDIAARLAVALERLPPESFTVQRLDELLLDVRTVSDAAASEAFRWLVEQLRLFADQESTHLFAAVTWAVPDEVAASLSPRLVDAEQAYAAAVSRPFQGRLLAEWASKVAADKVLRVRDAVRIGYVSAEPVAAIARRVRGTKAAGYADGVLALSRRDAEAVTRTAVSHVAGTVRDRFYDANRDLFSRVQWLSTLDTRTSEPCRLRDNKLYEVPEHRPVGHRLPWLAGPGRLHWNCRSTSVPVLKPWGALGGAEWSPKARASMDGEAPADLAYGDWLRRQSAARQDEVLGPVRARLFRKGGLALDRFATDRGRWLTLDELRARDAKAFERAGL